MAAGIVARIVRLWKIKNIVVTAWNEVCYFRKWQSQGKNYPEVSETEIAFIIMMTSQKFLLTQRKKRLIEPPNGWRRNIMAGTCVEESKQL